MYDDHSDPFVLKFIGVPTNEQLWDMFMDYDGIDPLSADHCVRKMFHNRHAAATIIASYAGITAKRALEFTFFAVWKQAADYMDFQDRMENEGRGGSYYYDYELYTLDHYMRGVDPATVIFSN